MDCEKVGQVRDEFDPSDKLLHGEFRSMFDYYCDKFSDCAIVILSTDFDGGVYITRVL